MIYNGEAPILGGNIGIPQQPIINRECVVLEVEERKIYTFVKVCYPFDGQKFGGSYQNNSWMTFTLRFSSDLLIKREKQRIEKGDKIAALFWIMCDKNGYNVLQVIDWYMVQKKAIS